MTGETIEAAGDTTTGATTEVGGDTTTGETTGAGLAATRATGGTIAAGPAARATTLVPALARNLPPPPPPPPSLPAICSTPTSTMLGSMRRSAIGTNRLTPSALLRPRPRLCQARRQRLRRRPAPTRCSTCSLPHRPPHLSSHRSRRSPASRWRSTNRWRLPISRHSLPLPLPSQTCSPAAPLRHLPAGRRRRRPWRQPTCSGRRRQLRSPPRRTRLARPRWARSHRRSNLRCRCQRRLPPRLQIRSET